MKHEQNVLENETASRQFKEGEDIRYWDENHKAWKKGVVQNLEGTKVIQIRTDTGVTRKHLDHVVKSHGQSVSDKETGVRQSLEPCRDLVPGNLGTSTTTNRDNVSTPLRDEPIRIEANESSSHSNNSPIIIPKTQIPAIIPEKSTNVTVETSRPKRNVNPPDRLAYSKLGGTN